MNVEEVAAMYIIKEKELIELGLLSVKYSKEQIQRHTESKQINTGSKLCLGFCQQ